GSCSRSCLHSVDPLLDRVLVGRDGFQLGQMLEGACEVPLLFLESGELAEDLGAEEMVRLGPAGLAAVPVIEREFPDIAGAGRVLTVLEVDAAQLEEKFGVAGVGLQSFAEKLLGLVG